MKTLLLTILASLLLLTIADYKLLKQGNNALAKVDVVNRIMTTPQINNLKYLFEPSPKRTEKIKYIVVHHDAFDLKKNSILAINKTHITERGWKSASYHYHIDIEANVSQLHSESENTPHVQGYNNISVGVCVQGNFENQELDKKQKVELIKLLNVLIRKYPTARVVGHSDLNPTTLCPGKNINVSELAKQAKDIHFLNL